MSIINHLIIQYDNAFNGPAWYGPALMEILANVDFQIASVRPRGNIHSIWELVLHITAWEKVVTKRLKGIAIAEPTEGDFPPLPEYTAQAWQIAIANLKIHHAELIETISAINDGELDKIVSSSGSTIYETIHGIMDHLIYHSGQIAILKKCH